MPIKANCLKCADIVLVEKSWGELVCNKCREELKKRKRGEDEA
jgi:exosome complex RNA-binding protein Csl4